MTFSLNFTHQMIGGEEGVDSQHLSIMGIISFINPFILKFWVLCISCVRNCADKGRAVSFEMTFPVFLFNVSQSFKTSRSTWRKLFIFFELVDSWSLNYYGLGWPGRTRGCATCGCAEWGFPHPAHPHPPNILKICHWLFSVCVFGRILSRCITFFFFPKERKIVKEKSKCCLHKLSLFIKAWI